jgi:L-glyceraldehyde 3-phosphate reductase
LKALGARPLVNTKVEIRLADHPDLAGHVVRSVQGSLSRLSIETIDVLQVHNGPCAFPPEQGPQDYARLWVEDYFRPGGVLEGLERVQRAGYARHVGFICRANDVVSIRRLIDTGLFRLINVPYTLLNPSAGRVAPSGPGPEQDFGGIIDYAQARGVGSAIYSPLASGDLTDAAIMGAALHPLAQRRGGGTPAHRRSLARAAAFRFLSGGGRTLAQAAVRFVLMHPGVTTVLGGFSDTAQLEEIAAVSGSAPLAAEVISRIEATWRDVFAVAD